MSSTITITPVNLDKIKEMIGSKRQDLKDNFFHDFKDIGDDPKDYQDNLIGIMEKDPQVQQEMIASHRKMEQGFVDESTKKGKQLIDEGVTKGLSDYVAGLPEMAGYKTQFLALTQSGISGLIDAMTMDPSLPQDLTSLLSYFTTGRKIHDGSPVYGDDLKVGYYTHKEVNILLTFLHKLSEDQLEKLGGLRAAVTELITHLEPISKDNMDAFITAD